MDLILSSVLIIIFIVIYMFLIQTFTVLFRITGLTKEKSRFQVISLLTNSGFTTSESELITTNRSRRKIAKFAMIIGTIFNVLIVSLLINIVVKISVDSEASELVIMGYSVLALVILVVLMRLPIVRKSVEYLIEKIATKINDKKHHENVITELDSYANKSIAEVYLSDIPAALKDTTIYDADLKKRYNIYILLIQRNSRVLDVTKDTILQKGDKLVLFGKIGEIRELFGNVDSKEEALVDTAINVFSIIDNYGINAMVEIKLNHLPEILDDKSLKDSGLKEKYDINLLMLKHNDRAILVDGNTKIENGDDIVLFGPYESIKTIFK